MSSYVTPSAQYAITMRLECPHQPGGIAKIAAAIAAEGGAIGAIDLVQIRGKQSLRDYSVECTSTDHANKIAAAVGRIEGVDVKAVSDNTFLMHLGGKLEIRSTVALKTRADLSMAYTPGVARVCTAIAQDPAVSFNLTIRKNCVAVISDGSAVLGLGNIGPEAAMPVMEGKAILFKEFGGVDALPLCIDSHDPDEIIRFCEMVAPSVGAINLEDIAAPQCVRIEQELESKLDIPVFHDDQHGTAIVVLAGTINALRLTGRQPADIKLVVSGAGAAGLACTRMLWTLGVRNIIVCDRKGAIHAGRDVGDNPLKQWLAAETNPDRVSGSLQKVLAGADMFLGLSAPRLLCRDDVATMAADSIIFAMANPTPEIMPESVAGLCAVMATGRSDYPNQINNVLAFPGIFRGALDARATTINDAMKHAAAEAIAAVVTAEELSPDYIIPAVFNRQIAKDVACAVRQAAGETDVCRRTPKVSRLI